MPVQYVCIVYTGYRRYNHVPQQQAQTGRHEKKQQRYLILILHGNYTS